MQFRETKYVIEVGFDAPEIFIKRGEALVAAQIVELSSGICYYYSRRIFLRKIYKYMYSKANSALGYKDAKRAIGYY